MGFGWPLGSSARYEMLGRSNGGGTTITASATANSKGSYATIGTTTFSYDGFWFSCCNTNTGTAMRQRVDIAVNNGGSDQIIAEDLYYDGSVGGNWYNPVGGVPTFIPVKVPKGAVVKARAQSSGSSGTIQVTIQGVAGDGRMIRGATHLYSATDWTNTDPTNGCTLAGTTLSAWAQVNAATANRFSALFLMLTGKGTGVPCVTCIWDVGWGASGSERVLFSVASNNYNQYCSGMMGHAAGPFPCNIPSGTRLAVRAQSGYSGSSGTLYPILYGLGG